jgi:hypothetical protein
LLVLTFDEEEDGGVRGRLDEFERFLGGKVSNQDLDEPGDVQRIDLEHVCVRIGGANDQVGVATSRGRYAPP